MKLGKRIKALRALREITQKELGKIMGVSQRAISHWESETNKLSMDQMVKLGKALDVDPSIFYQDISENEESAILAKIV